MLPPIQVSQAKARSEGNSTSVASLPRPDSMMQYLHQPIPTKLVSVATSLASLNSGEKNLSQKMSEREPSSRTDVRMISPPPSSTAEPSTLMLVEESMKNSLQSRHHDVPKFLLQLFDILHNESSTIIKWNEEGNAVQIYDQEAVTTQILPKYFNHTNFHSFQRQLNYFGFRKWTKSRTDICTFSHPKFLRNQPHLLHLIKRQSIPKRTRQANKRKDSNGVKKMKTEEGTEPTSMQKKDELPSTSVSTPVNEVCSYEKNVVAPSTSWHDSTPSSNHTPSNSVPVSTLRTSPCVVNTSSHESVQKGALPALSAIRSRLRTNSSTMGAGSGVTMSYPVSTTPTTMSVVKTDVRPEVPVTAHVVTEVPNMKGGVPQHPMVISSSHVQYERRSEDQNVHHCRCHPYETTPQSYPRRYHDTGGTKQHAHCAQCMTPSQQACGVASNMQAQIDILESRLRSASTEKTNLESLLQSKAIEISTLEDQLQQLRNYNSSSTQKRVEYMYNVM